MKKFEERESIVFENEGQRVFGIAHLPLTPPPHPAVLICHGLGGHKTGKFRLYVTLSEMLARNGIASLRFDFRGSGDSEGEFADASVTSELSDARKALKSLLAIPSIDPSRIGLFGRSFGGSIALMLARETPIIKSIATWAPIYSGDQWIEKYNMLHAHDVSDEHRMEAMKINGQVPGKQFFQELFQMNMDDYLNDIHNIPLLHIHGEYDSVVTVSHAENYHKARNHAQEQSKFIRLTQSDHDFSNTREQQIALQETVNWFKETL